MSNSTEVAQTCKRRIESLEIWLRRLIHDQLSSQYGPNFLDSVDDSNQNIIKKSTRENIHSTYNRNPSKYSRVTDATLLDDSIEIVCNPNLYNNYFKEALRAAFDDKGNLHSPSLLRNFCERLKVPRNNLSHANPISARQAEQVLSITGDLIESIKKYYRENGMEQDFNSPLILSITDHRGVKRYRDDMQNSSAGEIVFNFRRLPEYNLYPGDQLTISVDVDSAFDGEYKTQYSLGSTRYIDFHNEFTINIEDAHIGEKLTGGISVLNINKQKNWTRLYAGKEDHLEFYLKVLPNR